MSTEVQLKGDSLRRQLEASELYAKKHSLNLVESLQDIGISAFHGKNVREGALSTFIDLIEQGAIEKGSYLLIESLDRLSRDTVTKAFSNFTAILSKGITIVTLQDEMAYTEESVNAEPGKIFTSIGVMLRAHEESKTKSRRLKASWGNKRNNLDSKILTSICPKWLQAKDDKSGFDEIPKAVEAIRKIYQLALDGNGQLAITRILNDSNISTITKSAQWNISYVSKILKNESVTGRYQPHKMVDGKRVPIGDAIEDYFPQIISKAEYLNVQKGLKNRRLGGGRKGKTFSNLFSHIALCGFCGSSMIYINKGKKTKPRIVCNSAHHHSGCNSAIWEYRDFEKSIIANIGDLNISQVLLGNTDKNQKVLEDKITLARDAVDKLKKKQKENTEEWKKVDVSIKPILEEGIKEDQEEIERQDKLINEMMMELENIKESNISDCLNDVALFEEKIELCESDEEIYLIRSAVAHKLKSIIDKIEVYTDMKINPWEVDFLSERFVKLLHKKRYKTAVQIENYLATEAGQRLYVEDERYAIIHFKNGKTAWMKPSAAYFEFKPIEFDK